MPQRETPKLTLLEERKLQAAVLVPVLRAFRAELGEERANAIARKALYGWLLEQSQEMLRRSGCAADATPVQRLMAATVAWGESMAPESVDEVDYESIHQDETTWQFNVQGCRYAEYFRALGEPELGSMLLCSADNAVTEVVGAGLEFVRTGTIMRGADHCDFLWRTQETPKPGT